MFLPVPVYLARSIAIRSTQLARGWSAARGWKGTRYLLPSFDTEGRVGVRSTRRYMIYQSMGTKPFLMHSLEGKTIPIGRRLVKAVGVGQPGYVNLPVIRTAKDGTTYDSTQKVWRDQKWRHPGLKPQRFLQDSIMQAVKEHEHEIRDFGRKAVFKMIENGRIPDEQHEP